MDNKELLQLVEDLEPKIERLKAMYQQYFMGIEKIPPNVLRKDVERIIWRLRRERILNTATRFKFQQLISRHNTYQNYWQRVLRDIEKGTYKRDIVRAAQRFGRDGAVNAMGRAAEVALQGVTLAETAVVGGGGHVVHEVWEDIEDDFSDSISDAESVSDEVPTPPASGVDPRNWALFETNPPGPPALPPQAYLVPQGLDIALDEPDAIPEMLAQAIIAPAPAARGSHPGPRAPVGGAAWTPSAGTPQPRASHPGQVPQPRASNPGQVPQPRASNAGQVPQPRASYPGQVPQPRASDPGQVPQPRASNPGAPASPAVAAAAMPPAMAMPGRPLPPPPRRGSGTVPDPAAAMAPVAQTAAPVPAPHAVAQKPAARAARKPASRMQGAPKDDDKRTREIYNAYVQARREAGESTANVTFEKLDKSLRKQREQLRTKHGDRKVDFEVITKDGKALIRPVVK